MSLDTIRLDDLDWRTLVEAIRGRIAAASAGQWTLHAPVDPGITLLELFAHLLEQRVYWLDQVPEPLLRALLALLGEQPRSTQVAATVLAFRHREGKVKELPAGVGMRRSGHYPAISFTSTTGLALLPVRKIELHTADGERSGDLARGWRVRLLPGDGGTAEFHLVLCLDRPLPDPPPEQPLALLLDLDTPDGPPPQWSTDAVAEVPPPAQLHWYYSGPAGTRQRLKAEYLDDGTGGLRRSGLLRIAIPPDWVPLEPTTGGSWRYALWAAVECADFAAPPRLSRLLANAAIAHHQKTIEIPWVRLEEQLRDWLPLPGRSIQLPEELPPPLETNVQLHIRERDGVWYAWTPTLDFARHGPEDRVFTVDREQYRLTFGDGLTGRLPVLASDLNEKMQLCYLAGGGSAGNLGYSLTWEPDDSATALDPRTPIELDPRTPITDVAAVNPVSADGGAELEPAAAAWQRAAADLKARQRAVTAEDYEQVARATPGLALARAYAAVGHHPEFPCTPVPGAVTVFVLPSVPRGTEIDADPAFVAAPQPDPGALTAVRQWLDEWRLIGAEVFVRGITYRPVALAVTVAADPAAPQALEERLRQALATYLDPLVGGTEGSGWPFGQPLRPSELLRQAQAAVDEGATVQRLAVGIDGAAPSEDCGEVPIASHHLVYLAALRVELRRRAAAPGGLR